MNSAQIRLQISNIMAALFMLVLAVCVSPALSQGQTGVETALSPPCMSSDPNAVWDGQSAYPDCVFICKNGYHLDTNGKCVPDTSAGTSGSTSKATIVNH